jgi:transketolase
VTIKEKLLDSGISPGVAVNPFTELPDWIYSHTEDIDVVIIMSVNPGFAGQKFIPEVLPKMVKTGKMLRDHGFKGYIEADGGIDATNLQQVYDSGARILVAGSAVYGSSDIHGAIIQLRHKANVALEKRLIEHASSIGIRSDWMKIRKHILIPLASELEIEGELHAIK